MNDASSDMTANTHNKHLIERMGTGPMESPTGKLKMNLLGNEDIEIKEWDGHSSGTTDATIFSSVLNLSNTILGAGVLGLPFAVAKSGVYMGMVLFCVFGFLSGMGLELMCLAARAYPGSDFATLSKKTIPWAKTVVDVAVSIKCFGVGTSYMMVSGDLVPEVVKYIVPNDKLEGHEWILLSRQLWITTFVIIFIVPIVRYKYLDALRYISTFCLFFFGIVVLTIFLYRYNDNKFFDQCQNINDDCPAQIKYWPTDIKEFLGVLPIYIFGFTCHQNAFNVTAELHNPTKRRIYRVVIFTIIVCILIYGGSSYAGYTAFGALKNFPQDILSKFPDTWLTTTVRLVLSINLSFSYALQCNPCRNSLANLIFKKKANQLDDKYFYILTYGLTFSSWVIAMIVSKLGLVLAIVGATGSTTISYILPGLYYYFIFIKDKSFNKYMAIFLASLGICVVPFALTMVFLSGEGG